MKLRNLPNQYGIKVVRDGEFETLGLLSYQNNKMLVFVEQEKFIPLINKNYVSCVLCTPDLLQSIEKEISVATSESPRKAFYEIHNSLVENRFYPQPHQTYISCTAKIDNRAFVSNEGVHIGEHCIIEPNATILSNSWIGDGVVIRAGAIIGSEGFEFAKIGNEIISVRHAGGVYISDRVEIQSNCCIDKSVFGGYTFIGEDTKLDNLVHVAHNVVIGKRCRIAASVMIAGSTIIGNDVWLGPASAISSEVKIGDGASITIGSVVTKNVAPGQRVSGNFAIEHKRFIEFMKSIR